MSSFDIMVVAQRGRIEYEAALFAASLRARSPGFDGRFYVAEPQPGALWPDDPRMSDEVRIVMDRLGATHLPFTSRHFGAAYPQGNKVEALAALPGDRPVVFFDSDTLITGEIGELALGPTPSASMRRENTWPVETPGSEDAGTIWQALYSRFDLDFSASLDTKERDWTRFLYFNAGLIFAPDPIGLAKTMTRMMTEIRETPPSAQPLDPWLDQIALPLAITAHGGGRPEGEFRHLDGEFSLHYRKMPLLFATAPDEIIALAKEVAAPNWLKKVLKQHEPFRRYLYQGAGTRARALFDRTALPETERPIRRKLRENGLWIV